jgi:iron(III) transport system ATP-binding protein
VIATGAVVATGQVLQVERLTKRYIRGATPAVNDVSLTVETGEVVAVVGESGCGKTTLLRLLAGLEVPDAGSIRIGDRDVAGGANWISPEQRGIGMVFQDFALFPHMSVAANIAFGLPALSREQRRARVDEMLVLVGLEGFETRFPHQLSGGQQQRIALARALAPQPSLLLLDEPFSNLDTALKRSLRDELADILRHTGTTTILVVHDAEDVLLLADRAAVMRHGHILQVGDPQSIYRHPLNEYVARFFGETNILSGRACRDGFETPLGIVRCPGADLLGNTVRLCLRPEDLVFLPDGETGRAAVVQSVRSTGRRGRVLVSLENGAGHGNLLTVETGAEVKLAKGDRVYIGPKPACGHVIND